MPVFAQNIMLSAYGYGWMKRRLNGVFKEQVTAFKKRETYSAEEWHRYQTVALRKLLLHCLETVPYYKRVFKNIGLTRADISNFKLEDVDKIPLLEKEDLRKYGKTLLMSEKYDRRGTYLPTSGSTGTPLEIYFSTTFHQIWQAAMEARVRNWAGVTHKMPRGMIGGRKVIPRPDAKPPYYRYNIFEQQTYFSAYHISEKTVQNYVEGMKKNNVQWMTGYAVANYLLAKLINDSGIEAPQLKAVVTSSEKLLPGMRDEFYKAYGCKVYDSYSGNEACGLISENPNGELLFSPDTGIMEVLDDNLKQQELGVEGEVVFTGLINFDQPLIRYRIGDLITLSKNQQSTHPWSMPVVEEIAGRIEDKVKTTDGKIMVRFHSLYYNIQGIIRAQIVQESHGSFAFNIEIDNSFNKVVAEKIIEERLRSQINGVESIVFNYPRSIPNQPSGKFKSVISKIDQK
jgi:phenylacetate-CoA ligase